MLSYIQKFINLINKPKYYLLFGNVFLVFFLIILNNLEIIPLQMGDFAFFAVLTLAFALYRPGWAFLFFIGTLPLEIINLAPESLGIAVRPYQFIGALIILAILIRLATKKLNFQLAKLNLADYLVLTFVFAGFVSAIIAIVGTQNFASLRLAVILATFALLYFLTRNYIQNISDLKKVIPFFLSSGVVVVLYGIWQNIAFLNGANGFEVMPGRPNATFAEADWLGGYLVLLISICYVLLYYFSVIAREQSDRGNLVLSKSISNIQGLLRGVYPTLWRTRNDIVLYLLLASSYILLILTVSRSAWLGALAVTFIFLFSVLTNLKFNPREWQWKETFYLKLKILFSLAISVAIIYVFHLTNFQLLNRVESTGTGLQKITIACGRDAINRVSTDTIINNISELEKYDCRHINLEDIEKEKIAGNHITEIYRHDPNISIRGEIYQKSWQEIKNHPVFGIGWGNISAILGQDGRGTPLNSSNIFLETWLGAGVIGFASILALFSYILLSAAKKYFHSQSREIKALHLFIIISWFGIVVFNLFNAGIFLGFLWVWLAITQLNVSYANPHE